MPRFLRLAAACALSAALHACTKPPTTTHYRFVTPQRSQDPAYLQEISAGASGPHVVVDRDGKGRVTRQTHMRNGKITVRYVFQYTDREMRPNGYETFTGDELTGRAKISRDEKGNRYITHYYTTAGVETGYTLYTYTAERVESNEYTASRTRTSYSTMKFSASGGLIHRVTHANPAEPTSYVETEYDEATGLARTVKQIDGGKFTNRRTDTRNADGDLVRQDVFDASGTAVAFREYAEGLETRRAYQASGQITKDFRYSYDAKRYLVEARLSFKGEPVCRFTYDRLPNGTIKRTLAIGPSGDLWAEYPDQEVVDIVPNGQAVSGRPANLVKTGDWF